LRAADLSAAAAGPRLRAAEVPAVAVTGVLTLIVVLHIGLLDAGQWSGDEYYNFGLLRTLGRTYFWHRVLHWSPRPLSEGLVYAYWLAIRQFGPFIAPFLSLLWAMLAGATLAHLFRSDRAHALPRLLLGASILASFLLGHSVAEMFYWPMGAVAYLPTLAAVTYLVLALLDGRLETRGGRAGIAVALVVAAGSSELGALFVAGFLPLLLLLHRTRGAGRIATLWWMLVPFGLSLAVLGLTALAKGRMDVSLIPISPTLHHFWPSLGAALTQSAREFLSLDAGASGWGALMSGAATRVLLFLGFRWCLRRGGFGPVPAAHVLALSGALVLAGLASLVAGYDLFGFPCCPRHDTFRQCAYVLVLLALAGLRIDPSRAGVLDHPAVGPGALLVATLLAFDGRGAELVAAYRMYPLTEQARAETWQNGARPGPEMEFRDATGPMMRFIVWPTGRFTRDPKSPWPVWGIATFFDKQVVRIAPPPPDRAR